MAFIIRILGIWLVASLFIAHFAIAQQTAAPPGTIEELNGKFYEIVGNILKMDAQEPLDSQIKDIINLLKQSDQIAGKKAERDVLYINIKDYIINNLGNIKTRTIPINLSYALQEIIDEGKNILPQNEEYGIAKRSFDIYKSHKSAMALLSTIVNKTAVTKSNDDILIVREVMKYTDKTESRYYNLLSEYYKYIGASENEKRTIRLWGKTLPHDSIYKTAGRSRLAYLLMTDNDFRNSAVLYLQLESEYGGYAFESAYCAEQALSAGFTIERINYYKVIELYKRSNTAEGFYNAGLIYLRMFGSVRNARFMAEKIRDKYKDIEKSNALLDLIDKE